VEGECKLLVIQSDDFKFYYDVAARLRHLGIPFTHIGSSDAIPAGGSLVLKRGEEGVFSTGGRITLTGDSESVSVRAWLVFNGLVDMHSRVCVGIDPGERPGIAVLVEGKQIVTATAPYPEAAAFYTAVLSSLVGREKLLVRIGNGDPTNRDRIIGAVWEGAGRVEMVDERRTSRMSGSDEEAALLIGRSKGEAVRQRPDVSPSIGEIKNIQRRSRLSSGGLATLSRQYAEAVAKGEYTMDEALSIQLKANRKRN